MQKKSIYEAPSAEVWKVSIESGLLTASVESPDDMGWGGSLDGVLNVESIF